MSADAAGATTAAIVGASIFVTAFVVALGLALAARDTRDERDVLEAVGAPPRTLRRIAGTRAGVLALLGAVLATPTGLLPVWVVTQASRPVLPFTVPWASLAVLVVALPAAIAVVAVAGGSLTSRFRPTAASTFATD